MNEVSGALGADRSGRPDDDDQDLLTFGEAGARLREEIAQRTSELEQLEERLFYVAEDQEIAEQIAAVQGRIEALKAAEARLSRPAGERIAEAIEEGRRQLETLEERMFYVPDDQIATRIAEIEHRIEALQAAGEQLPSGGIAAEIDQARRQLEALEERMFYVAEDVELPTRIAAVQARIEELQRTARGPG